MSFLRASVDVEFCQTCSLTIGSSVEGAAAARALARVVGILSVLRVVQCKCMCSVRIHGAWRAIPTFLQPEIVYDVLPNFV